MMSIAATKGVYQLIRNPSYWEKTFHGLAQRPSAETPVGQAAEPAAAT
jgi:glycosyltransferase XagB